MMGPDEIVVRTLRGAYKRALRPILFGLNGGDAEATHYQMINLLGSLPDSVLDTLSDLFADQGSPVRVAGIRFPGRVGMAAGLDKNAVAARVWGALGFGFAEFGTVTPLAQPGNRRPRLFRLPHSRAIINRMGFNNAGALALASRLSELGVARGNAQLGIPVGISIGKNRNTPLESAVEDYVSAFTTVAPYADYIALNISSPNTPGLRSQQATEQLGSVVKTVVAAADEQDADRPVPIFVKISPDLTPAELDAVVGTCQDNGASGLIATNSTTARSLVHPTEAQLAAQAGGLSGRPLTNRAVGTVSAVRKLTDLPIIGCGGIITPRHAQQMFDAGAVLVQIYSGFIYSGVALVAGINRLTTPPRGPVDSQSHLAAGAV